MKIFVGIPVYDGKLQVQTVNCLLNESVMALSLGDELHFEFLPNCSHAAMGRNQLAQNFMNSDFERLIFLDADISFEPGSILKLAHQKDDFVGGAYRFKQETENYPVGWTMNDLYANEFGHLEVLSLPGGFLSISRKVFEDIKAAKPRPFEHFGQQMNCWFQMQYENGMLFGEDSGFCKEWRELGGQVWLDPELTLTHWDFNKPYVGHIGKWLKSRL